MTILQSVFLGIIQGFTEFLPISSSAHLAFGEYFFGLRNTDLFFSLLVHCATAISVVFFYRKEIIAIFSDLINHSLEKRKKSIHILLLIFVSMIPTGLLAFLIKETIWDRVNSVNTSALLLLVTGIIVFLMDFIPDKNKDVDSTGVKAALIIGFCQGIAVLPGISRSGITIFIALICGLERSWAVRFSFLMSLPVIFGMTLVEFVKDFEQIVVQPANLTIYIIGSICAGFFGYLAIKFVHKFIMSRYFRIFAVYCWVIGIVVFILT